MGFILLILVSLILGIVYRRYARKVGEQLFQGFPQRPSPARRYMDGQEFIPAPAGVLLGFQWMAVSLEPVLGAVIAVQFGWLPALLWLVSAAVLAGWVQDFTLTVISLRNAGANLGELAGEIISPVARDLLYSLVYLYLLLILGSFSAMIAPLISKENVTFGVLLLVVSGVFAGQLLFRQRTGVGLASLIAVPLGLAGIVLGNQPWAQAAVRWVNSLGDVLGVSPILHNLPGYGAVTWTGVFWTGVLLAICYLGAVLPVWRFALPVNYLSAWFGLLCMAGAVGGIILTTYTGTAATAFEIPALILNSQGRLGPLWPILCVTLTGGAVSGWHALVATFSTSRLLDKPQDALPVSVGATFMETILALLAIIFAASLGVSSGRYDPSRDYQLVAGSAGVFVSGMARFLNAFGLPAALADGFGVVLLVVLAITSLQLVVRFMRQASAGWLGGILPSLTNPHVSAAIAVLLAFGLAVFGIWQWLWVLFGSAGLLIAGLGLLIAAVWMNQQGRDHRWPLWAGIFLFVTGLAAMFYLAGYLAVYRGVIMMGGQTLAARLGNTLTAAVGAYFIYAGVVIFWSGMSKLILRASA